MINKFTRQTLRKSGQYLLTNDNEFVARFKYSGAPVTMAKFKAELIRSHSPAEYFRALNVERKTPLEILRSRNPQWYSDLKATWMAKQA
jgi:hypothetical protein